MSQNGDTKQLRLRIPLNIFERLEKLPGYSLNSIVVESVELWLGHREAIDNLSKEHVICRSFALCFSTAASVTKKPIDDHQTVALALDLVDTLTRALRQSAPPPSKVKHNAGSKVAKSAMSVMLALAMGDFSAALKPR